MPDPRGELNRAVKEQPKSYLGATFSLSDLTDRLGLKLDLAERALAAPDEDAVLDIAANAVGWQGSALLDLATGLHIDSIREKHGFTDSPVDDTLDEDEQILKALEQPASKMQFTFVEDNEELRRVIEGGDFAAWRTFLHPEQRKYVEQNFNGAFRLSGGAGTGKTVVAIHRARRMAKADPTARIVLTTYNKTLAADLKAALKTLDPRFPLRTAPANQGSTSTASTRSATQCSTRPATSVTLPKLYSDIAQNSPTRELPPTSCGARSRSRSAVGSIRNSQHPGSSRTSMWLWFSPTR